MFHWLQSSKSYRIFTYSSWAVLCMGIFMAFMLSPWFDQLAAMPTIGLVLKIMGGALGVVGAPAALIIWGGMAVFCLSEDRSSVMARTAWLILFFAAACFGAMAYFFIVYRKQLRLRELSSPA